MNRGRQILLLVILLLPSLELIFSSPERDFEDQVSGQPSKVIGGTEAQPGDFPWIAGIVRTALPAYGGTFCGGTLIDPNWVLTAAHCVEGEVPAAIEVVLGRQQLSDSSGERLAVADILIHPSYNPVSNDFDFALLELKSPSAQTSISILTPATSTLASAGVGAELAGWGTTSASGSSYPDQLRKATVNIVSNATCNEPESYDGLVTANMLCAGYADGGVDACFGDSGGPLIVPDGASFRLAGVVSWGVGCALPNLYGVYARVASAAAWINDSVQGQASLNHPPAVDAGDDVTTIEGELVELRGTATDPDGDVLTVGWVQESGPEVALSDPNGSFVVFRAPDVTQSVILTFEFRASDGQSSSSDRVSVKVLSDNHPPVVYAGEDQVVRKRQTVELLGSAVDPEGDLDLHPSWVQVEGPHVPLLGNRSFNARWTSPSLEADVVMGFELRVTDSEGALGLDRVQITVLGNGSPVVLEIGDREARAGEIVTFYAHASDPDSDPLTYEWEQVSDFEVSVIRQEEGEFVIRAPEVLEPCVLLFRLTVGDGLASVERTFKVFVSPNPELMVPVAFPVGWEPVSTFLGLGLLNGAEKALPVRIKGLSLDGRAKPPVLFPVDLPPNGQASFLTRDLQVEGGGATYLRLAGEGGEVRGMFLAGTYDGRKMDGLGGQITPRKVTYFPLFEGGGEEVGLFAANPNPNLGASLGITLYSPDGEILEGAAREIPPGGAFNAILRDLIGSEAPPGAYLQLRSDVPVVSYAFFSGPSAFTALVGQKAVWTNHLTGPHFFSTRQGGQTRIFLANRNNGTIQVVLRVFSDAGEPLASHTAFVEELKSFSGDVAALCGLSISEETLSGYFEVELTPVGWLALYQKELEIVGAVRFTGDRGKASATLPLVPFGLRESNYLHVAQSREAGIFTGLALVNGNTEATTVRVTAFSEAGSQTAHVEFRLEPGRRQIDLLNGERFFGRQFGQLGGHLEVISELPVAGFVLFGDYKGEFLSAVEGQIPVR